MFLLLQNAEKNLAAVIANFGDYGSAPHVSWWRRKKVCGWRSGGTRLTDLAQTCHLYDCSDTLHNNFDWLVSCLTARQHRKVNLCQLRGGVPTAGRE